MKKGIVWKYGDNVNTDVIFPGKYTYSILEPEDGGEIEIDFDRGSIKTARGDFSFPAFPESVMGILEAGGLIPYTKKKLEGK